MGEHKRNPFYVDERQIEAAVTSLLAHLRAGSSGSAQDECYVRCGQLLSPSFLRWQLGEMNRETDPQVMGRALVRVLGWIVANNVMGLPSAEERRSAVAHFAALIGVEAAAFAAQELTEETAAAVVAGRSGGTA